MECSMTTQIKGNATSTFGGNVDVTGNVITDAPAFSAVMSANQSISNATYTKIVFDTEEFDTNSNYDISNYRFTPTVAGYYQVNSCILFNIGATGGIQGRLALYKNGSLNRDVLIGYSSPPSWYTLNLSALVYMNGTTDYIEMYVQQSSGASQNLSNSGDASANWFQAVLARAV